MFASKKSGIAPHLDFFDRALIFETLIEADIKLAAFFEWWAANYPTRLRDFTYRVVRTENYVVSSIMES